MEAGILKAYEKIKKKQEEEEQKKKLSLVSQAAGTISKKSAQDVQVDNTKPMSAASATVGTATTNPTYTNQFTNPYASQAASLLNNASSSQSYMQAKPTAQSEEAGTDAPKKAREQRAISDLQKTYQNVKNIEGVNNALGNVTKRINNANAAFGNALKLQGEALDYAMKATGAGIANTVERAGQILDTVPWNRVENFSQGIYEYATGTKNLSTWADYNALKTSSIAQNDTNVQNLIASIEDGTFKGTEADIKRILTEARTKGAVNRYTATVEPWENLKEKQAQKIQENYPEISGFVTGAGDVGSSIYQFLLTAGLGAPAAGAGLGLSRGAKENIEQLASGQTTYSQMGKDASVDAALGALYSIFMGKVTSATTGVLNKVIPVKIAGKNFDLRPAVRALKHAIAGAGGGYIANGATGTLRNLYNLTQGRDVSAEDLKNPWWSEQSLKSMAFAAAVNTLNGMYSDKIKQENIKNVMNHRGELNKTLDNYLKDGTAESYTKGTGAIQEFWDNNSIGQSTEAMRNLMQSNWDKAFGVNNGALNGEGVPTFGPSIGPNNTPRLTAGGEETGVQTQQTQAQQPGGLTAEQNSYWDVVNVLKGKNLPTTEATPVATQQAPTTAPSVPNISQAPAAASKPTNVSKPTPTVTPQANSNEPQMQPQKAKTNGQKVAFAEPSEDTGAVQNMFDNAEMKKANLPVKDNQGREISKSDSEKLEGTKMLDKGGNVTTYFHGTDADFEEFDPNKIGSSYNGYNKFGKGFYFTTSKEAAKEWSNNTAGNKNVKEVYLNIKNPFYMGDQNSKETMDRVAEKIIDKLEEKTGKRYTILDMQKKYGDRLYGMLRKDLDYTADEAQDFLKDLGFDGISDEMEGYKWNQVVAFYPEQIIPVSGKEVSEGEKVMRKAEETFGETDNMDYAAWLTTNGTFLNFEGKGWIDGKPYRKDHFNVAYGKEPREYILKSNRAEEIFSEYGGIRLSPETPSIYLKVEPTQSQYEKLEDYIDNYVSYKNGNDPLIIEIPVDKGYVTKDYVKGTSGAKVIGDIKKFFSTGTMPDATEYNVVKNKDKSLSARFTPNRLESIMFEGDISEDTMKKYPKTATRFVTRMTPQQFLQLTLRPDQQKYMEEVDPDTHALNTDQLKSQDQNIYLRIDLAKKRVVGHEGRHRMIALKNAGFKTVDVVIELESGDYRESYGVGWKDIPHIDELRIKGQYTGKKDDKNTYGKATTLYDLDPVSYDNIDYLKKKYLGTRNKGDIIYEKEIAYEKEEEPENYSTYRGIKIPKKLPEELPATRRKFLEDIKTIGYVNVNGAKLSSAADVADLAQCFRDPVAETFRGLFLKDGKVIVQTALTREDPRKVPLTAQDFARIVSQVFAKTGADSFWVIHNHPDAQGKASGGDKNFTKTLGEIYDRTSRIKFLGQIVIDHNEYASISPSGQSTDNIKLKEKTYNEIEDKFSKEAWNNVRLFGNKSWEEVEEKVAALACYVKNSPDMSTLILATNWGDARVLQSLPNKFFNQSKEKIKAYAKDLALKNGATVAFYATQDLATYNAMKKNVGSSPGIVLYKTNEDNSITILKSTKVGNTMLYASRNRGAKLISPSIDEQLNGPQTSLEEIKNGFEEKKATALRKKTTEKKPVERTEEKPQPAKRLEKSSKIMPIPTKGLETDLDKANQKIKELEKTIERLKTDTAKKTLKKAQAAAKKKEKDTEEKRFKAATPKVKLRMLSRKIDRQTGYYEISNFPELDAVYEREFGKTIRATLKTLYDRNVYPYLPDVLQNIVRKFVDETYLKANWKTFDKYLREAIEAEEIKKLIESTNAPVSSKLLEMLKAHKQAPIVMKTAQQMYDDLMLLQTIIDVAEAKLNFRRENPEIVGVMKKVRPQLELVGKWVDNKELPRAVSMSRSKWLTEPEWLNTAIQATAGGNPNTPLMKIWDWFYKGNETSQELSVMFARNFDPFLKKTKTGWAYKDRELGKDFAKKPEWVDTGITGSAPNGEKYKENLKLRKDMIMHIVGGAKNQDNLMAFCKILLGKDAEGKPVYSNPGGYIVPDKEEFEKGHTERAYEKGKKYVFTRDEIKHLADMLNPAEQEFVNACLEVGRITARYGNKVSQQLVGRDIFTVDNYIRILRDLDAFDGELIDPAKLQDLSNVLSSKYKHIGIEGLFGRGGSTEARNHKSTKPIYGESLLQAVTNSFAGASKYISYAIPLYDANMLLDARYPDTFKKVKHISYEDDPTKKKGAINYHYVKVEDLPVNSAPHTTYLVDTGDGYDEYVMNVQGDKLKKLITLAGGEDFYKYYDDFVQGLIGKRPYNPISGLRAKAVLNANLSVAATQFFSYFQIGQFLDHPLASMVKGLVDRNTMYKIALDYLKDKNIETKGLKKQEVVNKMLEEEVTFLNSFRGLRKFNPDIRYVEEGSALLGRVNTGYLMSVVDKFTVDATFRVLAYDIMANGYKPGTEEFFKEFKRRLPAVYQSNPQYAPIYRTPMQNLPGAFRTAFAQFNTVPIEGYNNALQMEMGREYFKKVGGMPPMKPPTGTTGTTGEGEEGEWNFGTPEDLKAARKRAHNYWKYMAMGIGLFALMKVALQEALDQNKDKTFGEKFILKFIQNTLSYTIIGDEIFSALAKFEDYDITTNDLSWVNGVLDTIGYLGSAIVEGSTSDAIKAFKGALTAAGLPASGIENVFNLLGKATQNDMFKAYSVLKDKNASKKFKEVYDQIDGDIITFYDIRNAMNKKVLAEDYGFVEGSKTDDKGSKKNSKIRAIKDILGLPQNKPLTGNNKKEFEKWWEVFKNS